MLPRQHPHRPARHGVHALSTLLHELAHALTADAYGHCADDWTHTRPNCAHDGVFRCAADALYQRYADMDAAGVCGADPTNAPGQWFLVYPGEVSWGTIHATAGVRSIRGGHYTLFVRCRADLGQEPFLDAAIGKPAGEDEILSVRYRVDGETRLVDLLGGGPADFWWLDAPDAFIDQLEASRRLWVAVTHLDGSYADLSFDLGDSPALDIVNAWCD